jgi:hypothetical protein
MLRKWFLWVFACLSAATGVAQEGTVLTPEARISLLTCGPGNELYSAFGHSAIRIKDPAYGDIVFNYGTFSFDQPNFYLRFAQGRLLYRLSVESFRNFEEFYIYENRSITEQELNLTLQQKQKLYDLLAENYLPENREYRYHFFYDNCSTRIRDIIEKALNNEVSYQYPDSAGKKSFRQMTDEYLIPGKQSWGDFGIDLCLGLPTDHIATAYQEMFLPDYLMHHFDQAIIGKEMKPLVTGKKVIFDTQTTFTAPVISPNMLTWALFILVMFFTVLKRSAIGFGTFDYILFGLSGLLGILFLLLWVATDHTDTKYNFNLLWALPTHLALLPLYAQNPTFRKRYFAVTALIGLILLVMWPVLPQDMHEACIPLVLLLSLRSYYLYRAKIQ